MLNVLDYLSDIFHQQPLGTQARAAAPFEVNIPGLFGRYSGTQYRSPSVRDALGVPAILKCVTLIANTAGALSMNGIRDGAVVPAADRPRLIVRPNPLTRPRDFWRDTAFWKATYGESWWWVAKRDSDGMALSLFPVSPREIRVEEDPSDRRYPIVWWRDRRMPRGDMILDMLLPDPDRPHRGIGPLQLCGAAVSAAVEAQEWAANFYAEGGYPSVWARPETPFASEDDAQKFKQKWTSTPPNTPMLVEGIEEIGTIDVNAQGAQMLNARAHNFGEVALMFGLPDSMVSYARSGGSLTYQNVGQIFDEFVKVCLWPNYLEGTEQAMTDLLPRTWVAEFDTDRFTRPDPKTRAEIHSINITSGVYDAAYAQKLDGITPGSIETAPIPPSPPAAVPPVISRAAPTVETRAQPTEFRCDGLRRVRKAGIVSLEECGKLLSKDGRLPEFCPRCKKVYSPAVA